MWWKELWEHQKGACIGTAGGIVLGFLYLIVGFWDTLIFAFIVFIGYYLGKKLDRGEQLFNVETLLRWLSERWSLFR